MGTRRRGPNSGQFYLWGYRWIKSREAWSKRRQLYHFPSYTDDESGLITVAPEPKWERTR